MVDDEELIDRFVLAGAGFEDRLREVRSDQWAWPTPCTEWDVRAVTPFGIERAGVAGCHQGRGPPASKKPPVGPSGPTCAIRTMISEPSSTVCVPVRPFRSVAV